MGDFPQPTRFCQLASRVPGHCIEDDLAFLEWLLAGVAAASPLSVLARVHLDMPEYARLFGYRLLAFISQPFDFSDRSFSLKSIRDVVDPQIYRGSFLNGMRSIIAFVNPHYNHRAIGVGNICAAL